MDQFDFNNLIDDISIIEEIVSSLKKHYNNAKLHYDIQLGFLKGPRESEKESTLSEKQAIIGVNDGPRKMANAYLVLVEKQPEGEWKVKKQLQHFKGGCFDSDHDYIRH